MVCLPVASVFEIWCFKKNHSVSAARVPPEARRGQLQRKIRKVVEDEFPLWTFFYGEHTDLSKNAPPQFVTILIEPS